MVEALKRYDSFINVSADWSHTLAVCRGTWIEREVRGRWQRTPEVARVYLPAHSLGAGLVAHELTHAAVMWARRVRLSGRAIIGDGERGRRCSPNGRPLPPLVENNANERFADVMGHLNYQFWRAWWKR